MRTLRAQIHYSTSWIEEVEVEIPDEADEVGADCLLDRAISLHRPTVPNDIDVDDHGWVGEPSFAPPWPDIPGASDWIDVPGYGRWVTDGRIALREGRPYPPRSKYFSWQRDADGDEILALICGATFDAIPDPFLSLPTDKHRRQSGPVSAISALRMDFVLHGLEIRYGENWAVGYDPDGQPQAIAALWRD